MDTRLSVPNVTFRSALWPKEKEGRKKERKQDGERLYRWTDNHESPLPDYLDSPYDFLHWFHTNQTLQIKLTNAQIIYYILV